MSKSKSPITVQQWVDALPASPRTPTTPTTPKSIYNSPAKTGMRLLARDMSMQSDDLSSHCSSIESVLEFRRSDPEAVLIGLGFGPANSNNSLPRIPQRFLQPSKLLTQIDIEKFLEEQGQNNNFPQQFNSNPSSPARIRPNPM